MRSIASDSDSDCSVSLSLALVLFSFSSSLYLFKLHPKTAQNRIMIHGEDENKSKTEFRKKKTNVM